MAKIVFSRRDFLKTAGGLAAASAFGGLATNAAFAAELLARRGAPVGHDFTALDQVLRGAVARHQVPAVVAVGATESGLVYQGAFGKESQPQGRDISLDTVFWIASMTKAVTATACMQLIEQGKLQLEQPAGQVLPELASPQLLEGFDASGKPILRAARRQITIRHLLTHTSGYTYPYWSANMARYLKTTGLPSIDSGKLAAFKAPIEFEPGERWEYGISMDWIGRIVEQVSGQSLEDYFRKNIFAPLGMANSGFRISSAQRARLATHYQRQADGSLVVKSTEPPQDSEFFSGGGGLFSTPRDYIALLQMLLHQGRFNGAQVLKPETVAAMDHNHIGKLNVQKMITADPKITNSFDQFPGMPHKWGLSFDINPQPGPNGRAAGSMSWAGLHNSYYWIDPVKRVTGALFTQVLPFYDGPEVDLYGRFEKGLYAGLSH